MAWIGALASIGGSLLSGYMGSKGSKDASSAQAAAAQQQLELQRQIYNSQMQGQEPFRATGVGANNVLAQLYGLGYYDYSPTPQVGNGFGGLGGYAGGMAQVAQDAPKQGQSVNNFLANPTGIGGTFGALSRMASDSPLALPFHPLGPLGALLGGHPATPWKVTSDGTISVNGKNGGKDQMGGTIDPRTGVFTPNNDPNGLAGKMNQYLQTGVWEGGAPPNSVKRFIDAADTLRQNGWTAPTNSINPSDLGTNSMTGGPNGTDANVSGQLTSNPTGLWEGATDPNIPGYHPGTGVGDLSVFQSSPGYQFRLSEGLRGVQNSAAAGGEGRSGNALRAIMDYAQGTASSDFYNFVNQMNSMAGYGQTATNNQQSAGTNFGIGAGNALGAAGDARASGIAGSANMWGQAANGIGNALGDYWGNRNSGINAGVNSMAGLSPITPTSQYKYNFTMPSIYG